MKRIGFTLSLVTALLLSACDSTSNQTDNSRNDQAPEKSEIQANNKVNTPTLEKIENAPEEPAETVSNDNHKKDIIKFGAVLDN